MGLWYFTSTCHAHTVTLSCTGGCYQSGSGVYRHCSLILEVGPLCPAFHESLRRQVLVPTIYLISSVHKQAFTSLDLAVGGLTAWGVETMALGPRRGTSRASDKPSDGLAPLPDSPAWSAQLLEGSQQPLSAACVTTGQTYLTCQCLGLQGQALALAQSVHDTASFCLSITYVVLVPNWRPSVSALSD